MEYLVRIHKKGKITEKKAQAGTNLLKFLRKNDFEVSAPCGGNGTCGKCKVKVEGIIEEPTSKELKHLGIKDFEKGFRLACYNNINSDLEIFMDRIEEGAEIVTEGKERNVKLDPIITKKYIELDVPNIEDQKSDIDRVKTVSQKLKVNLPLELIRELPEIMRTEDFKVTIVSMDKKVIAVEPGDNTNKMYGIAVDIGTTTVAAYLIDMNSGRKIDVFSAMNPQRKFGADVVSRINYTLESKTTLNEMHKEIIACMNQAVKHFTQKNGITRNDIYAAVFVGNTTMMHFLMKISAKNIAASPFIPVTTQLHKLKAKEIGVNINPLGLAVIFPSVSAYIGADTVAAVLSSGMYEKDKTSLLVDLGTNGEIVLGNNKWLYACSAAAGPAFEGANIRNGIGGVKGAIDKVKLGDDLEYTTIGNGEAVGICGSGVVDAAAAMLSVGVVDETGRIQGEDEVQGLEAEKFSSRLVDIDGMSAFLLVKSDECAANTDIAITQKDIRELQNAKAAIAAGIKILVKNAGINMEDIDKVYLAGGFGSYINIDSALKIGLLPKVLNGRIESIGNAAGSGAVEGLLSIKMLKKADEIRESIKYVELSACAGFMDEYVECMMFEE